MKKGNEYKFCVSWEEGIILVGSEDALESLAKGDRTKNDWRLKGIPSHIAGPLLYAHWKSYLEEGIGRIEDVRLLAMVNDLREILAMGQTLLIDAVRQAIKAILSTARALRRRQQASGKV